VDKLRCEIGSSRRSSRYECSVYHPETDSNRAMGFPCLSSVAFHLDCGEQTLHLAATYRNQHLVERGYGNYLGLSRLRDYVAVAAGLASGELMVVAGHARADGRRTELRALLAELDQSEGRA
jgi:thymidylate synthase